MPRLGPHGLRGRIQAVAARVPPSHGGGGSRAMGAARGPGRAPAVAACGPAAGAAAGVAVRPGRSGGHGCTGKVPEQPGGSRPPCHRPLPRAALGERATTKRRRWSCWGTVGLPVGRAGLCQRPGLPLGAVPTPPASAHAGRTDGQMQPRGTVGCRDAAEKQRSRRGTDRPPPGSLPSCRPCPGLRGHRPAPRPQPARPPPPRPRAGSGSAGSPGCGGGALPRPAQPRPGGISRPTRGLAGPGHGGPRCGGPGCGASPVPQRPRCLSAPAPAKRR